MTNYTPTNEPHTLILWNEIPESLKTYMVPDSLIESLGIRGKVDRAHGQIINSSDETDGADAILDAISTESHEYPSACHGAFVQFEVENLPAGDYRISHIISTGFAL